MVGTKLASLRLMLRRLLLLLSPTSPHNHHILHHHHKQHHYNSFCCCCCCCCCCGCGCGCDCGCGCCRGRRLGGCCCWGPAFAVAGDGCQNGQYGCWHCLPCRHGLLQVSTHCSPTCALAGCGGHRSTSAYDGAVPSRLRCPSGAGPGFSASPSRAPLFQSWLPVDSSPLSLGTNPPGVGFCCAIPAQDVK